MPYNYALDNPVMFVDPDGMKAKDYPELVVNNMPSENSFANINGYNRAEFAARGGGGGGPASVNMYGNINGGGYTGNYSGFWNSVLKLYGMQLANSGVKSIDKWKIATMTINSRDFQKGLTDCVPTVGKVAAELLGISVDVKDKQSAANLAGGVPANRTKEYFESIGLKVNAIYENKGDYYFGSGIPDGMKQQAIKFIVDNITNQYPVYIGYSEPDGLANLQGHAVLVKEIQYREDFSEFRYIKTWDPQIRSGIIYNFRNSYGFSQNIYNIFSFSKP